ncbi:MAG: hypothetical protein Kow0040_29290 [Thermogutta sp.]
MNGPFEQPQGSSAATRLTRFGQGPKMNLALFCPNSQLKSRHNLAQNHPLEWNAVPSAASRFIEAIRPSRG